MKKPIIWAGVLVSSCLIAFGPWAMNMLSGETSSNLDSKTIQVYEGNEITYTQKELKAKLSPIQYKVIVKDGTEKAFDNKYWNNKKEGIYVDVLSGEPLFSSKHKFDSGTGWPSFFKPLEADNIVTTEDPGFFGTRTEVRSKGGNAHLGHVFKDGPEPTGLRYCLNSAALTFIPKDELEEKGYGEYVDSFK